MSIANRFASLSRFIAILIAPVGFALPVHAQQFDAGVACDFPLLLELHDPSSNGFRFHDFYDRDGNLVRLMLTGNVPKLTFTNLSNGQSYTLKSYGQQHQFELNADGSTTYRANGHSVLTWYPTDVPPGPDTFAYVGYVEAHIAADGVWTLIKQTGKVIDVCEILE